MFMWGCTGADYKLKNQVHPSSVDALCLVRAQLETLYAICYMVEKASSVNDFLKNDWKNRYVLPRNQCRGTLEVFESRTELWTHDGKRNRAKQGFAEYTPSGIERKGPRRMRSDCAVNSA